jgi:hypothetical protein
VRNLPKFFSDQSLVPRTGAAAVSLRPVDDGCGLAAETHDLLDSPCEEHGERVACHLLGMIRELFRACWRIYGVHLFGFKESVLMKNGKFETKSVNVGGLLKDYLK